MIINGLMTKTSAYTPFETVEKLLSAISELGIDQVVRIDHAAAAHKVLLPLLFSEVIIFGNPVIGTLLMQATPTLALDLPLKMLVWQDVSGITYVSYNQPEWLANRHGLECHLEHIQSMAQMMNNISNAATVHA